MVRRSQDTTQMDTPFPYQALLRCPTGGGRTLCWFLPARVGRAERDHAGLHTLYISPLKALAADIHRNLTQPIEEMGLAIACETRTGDTPQSKRQRQRRRPHGFLMTTPDSLALLLSYYDVPQPFANLKCVRTQEYTSALPSYTS